MLTPWRLPNLTMMTRVIVIVAIAMLTTQLLALGGFWLAGSNRFDQSSPVAQAEALTRLLDAADSNDARQQIVTAAGGESAGIRLIAHPPTNATPRLNRLRELLRVRLDETLPGRQILIESGPSMPERFALLIQLRGGDYLRMEISDRRGLRILAVPIGLVVGILGLAIALAAVLAVRHELKPLRRLADQVSTEPTLAPSPIEIEGAPEVRQLIRAINRMREKNATLIANRALTFAAISHDLRTYLTRLRLRIEMIGDPNQRQRAAATIEEMESLIDQTIDFAGRSSNRQANPRCDAREVVQQCLERYGLPDHGLDIGDRDCQVPMNASDLTRVVNNLLDNASRYASDVEVRLALTADAIIISVADRGPGIAPEMHDWIVEPFTRLEGSRNRSHGGSGLGLAIVSRLVREASGDITLHQRDGGGLLCRVTLPLADIRYPLR